MTGANEAFRAVDFLDRITKAWRGCLWTSAVICLASAIVTDGGPAQAAVALDEDGKIKIFGDFRARYENDWDSQRANGRKRDDRARARIRARFGAQFDPIPELTLSGRVRTGSKASQQSPHVTIVDFSGDDHGDRNAVADKWFARANLDPVWAWGGKNGFPFWKQNELFWDDDATLTGGAAGAKFDLGGGNLQLTAGYFALPDGMTHHAGRMAAGQAAYTYAFEPVSVTGAVGYFDMNGDRDGDVHLRNRNGERDYSIIVANLQAKVSAFDMPLAFGVDVMHNTEDYSANDSDSFTAANHDETDGFVLSAKLGQLKEAGDWLAAYYYARIETFAVNASFAQDDWVRWGSATQTDSSDLKGHEFRLAYAIASNMNLVARLYIVDAITSAQDGNRFRLDFNIKF